MCRAGDFPLLPGAAAGPYPRYMSEKQPRLGRVLLFVRRVMPNATEEELIEASDRVRRYAAFVIRMQERIERDRQAAIRENRDSEVDSESSHTPV